jgi:hypothetical protein
VDQAERIYFEAYRLQGAAWVVEEPLWLSWTLDRFGKSSCHLRIIRLQSVVTFADELSVNSIPPLITLHNHHLAILTSLASIILNPETSFDDAKLTLERWADLSMGGQRHAGVKEWEELVELEMSAGGEDESDVEEERSAGSGRKKKGRN